MRDHFYPKPLLPVTDDYVRHARDFVFNKWKQRALAAGASEPTDLSGSSTYSSLFAQMIFGGNLVGNPRHQFVELPSGAILDLNTEAKDVRSIFDPYYHDPDFWLRVDQAMAIAACLSTVSGWTDEFMQVVPQPVPGLCPANQTHLR